MLIGNAGEGVQTGSAARQRHHTGRCHAHLRPGGFTLAVAAILGASGTLVSSWPVEGRELALAQSWRSDGAAEVSAASRVEEATPAGACRAAVGVAEAGRGLPPGLLLAIARVETGRRDARTGALEPWPWSVNSQGQSLFFTTKPLAIDWVRQAQKSGLTSIDVGCMQVNLQYHPQAFRSLEDAFDPEHNARYAVSFLTALHGEAGDWMQAAGLYHSRRDELATSYRQQVATIFTHSWPGVPLVAAPVKPTTMQTLRAAWSATLIPTDMTGLPHREGWSFRPSGDAVVAR